MITLKELMNDVAEKEAITKESPQTQYMLEKAAISMILMAQSSDKIRIFTDYDADGITSAYIMQKAITSINPNCQVKVECNDRRGSYGLSADTLAGIGEDERCIVLDMGSAQIPDIEASGKKNIMVIDHHLVRDEKAVDAILSHPRYCNPHVLNDCDRENAQYCAAGLAYRLYSIAQEKGAFDKDVKRDTTVLAMACIGTASDMVDVLDTNSLNRKILKDGVEAIDNADLDTMDFVIGYMISSCGVDEHTTAHQLAFNVGAFLNAPSRMSELIEQNGAQRMYDAITAPEDSVSTFKELDRLMELNTQRKALISDLTSSAEYQAFVNKERIGENIENNICVYILPEDTPSAFAGLIAGKLEEACDKAAICLTHRKVDGVDVYSGSARNPESNKTSLVEFMDKALDGSGLDIKYGGHENAMGISRLTDIDKFLAVIESHQQDFERKERQGEYTLDVAELSNQAEALEAIKALEPTGIGLQLPSVSLRGSETYRDKLFKRGHDNWKTVRLKQDGVSYDIADWAYNPECYPQGKKSEIAVTATLGISSYGGEHVEMTAKFSRSAYLERLQELGIDSPAKPMDAKPPDTIEK